MEPVAGLIEKLEEITGPVHKAEVVAAMEFTGAILQYAGVKTISAGIAAISVSPIVGVTGMVTGGGLFVLGTGIQYFAYRVGLELFSAPAVPPYGLATTPAR